MQIRALFFAALCCAAFALVHCKKDNNNEEENPFFSFFQESSIKIDTVQQAGDTWEYGFTFTPLASGKVTKLGIKVPAQGEFTATLWDLSGPTPVVLGSKSINSATQHADTFGDIPAISLEKDVKYGVTIRANAFYRLSKPGNVAFSFPKTVGNIRIDSFIEAINNTSDATFPPSSNDTRVAPCVTVIFIAD